MVGITDYPAFVGAVIVFLAIPGPGNLALLTATAHGGRRGGMFATAGVIAGDQVLIWAGVAGLAAVLTASPAWFHALQWLGATYLAYLALQMWRQQPQDAPVMDMSSGRYFRKAFFVTLLNPKAIVFYMAFFPLFLDTAQPPNALSFLVMASTIAALTFVYGFTLTLLAYKLAHQFSRYPRIGQWLQKTAAVLLVGFGLRLVLQK
jgi:threonine/homoserine/homoserine lactone efflux protein